MAVWTVVVARSIHAALVDIGYSLHEFNKCALTGKLDGKPVRIISVHGFPQKLCGIRFDRIVWHGFTPSPDQRAWVEARKHTRGTPHE